LLSKNGTVRLGIGADEINRDPRHSGFRIGGLFRMDPALLLSTRRSRLSSGAEPFALARRALKLAPLRPRTSGMADGFRMPEGMEVVAADELVDLRAPRQSPAALGGGVLDGARIAALHDLGLLDTEAEEDFDRYTRLATDLLGVPVSLVSLVDADRQFFKSQTGLTGDVAEALQTPLSHSFCKHTVASHQPLVVSDAREHPLVADNLAIRDLGVIAYAGMPLVLSDGHAVGAFCVSDSKPRNWSKQDIRILGDLAAAVTSHLNLRKALAEQGLHDRLTGLPNRVLLCAQADQLLELAGSESERSVAAICMGLDSFGLVNDAYGAGSGDRVLQQVAERLAAQVRGGDAFGRSREPRRKSSGLIALRPFSRR
jgi:GAF domain-containing protein